MVYLLSLPVGMLFKFIDSRFDRVAVFEVLFQEVSSVPSLSYTLCFSHDTGEIVRCLSYTSVTTDLEIPLFNFQLSLF